MSWILEGTGALPVTSWRPPAGDPASSKVPSEPGRHRRVELARRERTWGELLARADRVLDPQVLRAVEPADAQQEDDADGGDAPLAPVHFHRVGGLAELDPASLPGADDVRVVSHGERLTLVLAPGAIDPDYDARLAATYAAALAALDDSLAGHLDGQATGTGDPRDPLLPPADQTLLQAMGQSQPWPLNPPPVPARLRTALRAWPERQAIRWAEGSTTFAELDRLAAGLRARLMAAGVQRGDVVGLLSPRCPTLVAGILACWDLGAAYLPLDPQLPTHRLDRMVAMADPVVVLVGPGLPAVTGELATRVLLCCSGAQGDPPDALRAPAPGALPPPVDIDPDDLAYVIFTSGSTGLPQAVLVSHRGVANYLEWTSRSYNHLGDGGAPVLASISFDQALPTLLTPLLDGLPTTLMRDGSAPGEWIRALEAGSPYSFVMLTPSHLELLLAVLPAERLARLAGVVVVAGDAFRSDVARAWQRAVGPEGTPLAVEYGPTEITVGNSGMPLTEVPPTGLIPLGRPIPGTSVHVLTERLRPVPIGVVGDIHVGGTGVSRGYLGGARLTADRFVPDPFGPPGARLYRTGDLGRWLADGSLDFVGRADRQVKVHGVRVEPAEIEAVLARCAGVGRAVVAAVPLAAGAVRLVGFVTPASAEPLDPTALRVAVARELPPAMVPTEIRVCAEIPLTGNGKVDVAVLLGLRP